MYSLRLSGRALPSWKILPLAEKALLAAAINQDGASLQQLEEAFVVMGEEFEQHTFDKIEKMSKKEKPTPAERAFLAAYNQYDPTEDDLRIQRECGKAVFKHLYPWISDEVLSLLVDMDVERRVTLAEREGDAKTDLEL